MHDLPSLRRTALLADFPLNAYGAVTTTQLYKFALDS
jgi:hypothetical protein